MPSRRRTGHAAARDAKRVAAIILPTVRRLGPDLGAVYVEAVAAASFASSRAPEFWKTLREVPRG